MLVTAPAGHPPPLDLPGPCLVPAWPAPLSAGPFPFRIGLTSFPSSPGSGPFPLTQVSAGRTGCPFVWSALGLPPRACPIIHWDIFLRWVTHLCVFFLPLRLRDTARPTFPVTSGPPGNAHPPPSRVLGPSTLYGRPRSKNPGASCCRLVLHPL